MDSSDREMIARIWQVAPDEIPGKGLSAFEMLDSIGDPTGISALLVVGSNVAVASPNMTRIAERLQQLDFLGVLDAIPNETTAKADVVLPVTMWAEEDGTTTNLEGRVIRRRKTLEPPSGVKSDIEVLCALAARLGNPSGFIFNNPEEVFAELARATAGARADYSGITYEKIDHLDGVFWPCPSPEHPGTARLFADRFHHSDGRAKFVPVVHRPAGEEPDDEFPIYLTTGRYKEHYNSGAQTRRVERLTEAKPEACIHIHPLLAERTGLKAGAKALVESRRGTAMFSTVLDPDIRANTVFAPFHWGDRSGVNRLTNTALDPTSRMPEFKICAVRLLAAP